MELQVTYNQIKQAYELDGDIIRLDNKPIEYSIEPFGSNGYILSIDGTVFQIYDIEVTDEIVSFTHKGKRCSVPVKNEQTLLLEKMGFKTGSKKSEGLIKAPMPGKILRVELHEGQTVEVGQTAIVLEAMKMENELKSPSSGKVVKVHVIAGDSVEKNTTLIEIG